MKILLKIALIFFTLNSFSQGEANMWYFGSHAGLDFNNGSPQGINISGLTELNGGSASIADADGNLLFYTNGITVWNKNNEVMLNGSNLEGADTNHHGSSIIIPKPENPNAYYIFTTNKDLFNNSIPIRLWYSEVDMSLDSGLGGVTSNKNILLLENANISLTATKHPNGTDYWLLVNKINSSLFYAYKITNSGIQEPVISSVSSTIDYSHQMKFSSNSKKIAINTSDFENQSSATQLIDFNGITGTLSNTITLNIENNLSAVVTMARGVEFSPSSNILYVTRLDKDENNNILNTQLHQYNLQLPGMLINNSRVQIDLESDHLYHDLQLAPDGKIYVAIPWDDQISVISNPNILGVSCDYQKSTVSIGNGTSSHRLPLFVQSFSYNQEMLYNHTCYGDETQFNLINPLESQMWNFGDRDSSQNTSTLQNPTHIYSSPGTYYATVTSTNIAGQLSTIGMSIVITENPEATNPEIYTICDDDENPNDGRYSNINLIDIDPVILGDLDSDEYIVEYYTNSSLTNIIDKSIPYQNSSTYSQTIYAKLFYINNETCFDTLEFDLKIHPAPLFDLEDEITICSNKLPQSISVTNPQGEYLYQWLNSNGNNISTDQEFVIDNINTIPQETTELTVIATDPITQCQTSKTILIHKFDIGNITLNDILINHFLENPSININIDDDNLSDYLFTLDFGFNDIGSYQSEPFFQNVIPGIRKLYIKDIYNCGEQSFELFVTGFPHFFTPNNDGYNDYWNILGLDKNNYTTSIIRVFDRFGKIVANIKPSSDGWDGMYNGKELPETDYWFTAQFIDNNGNIREQKGHFSLIRR